MGKREQKLRGDRIRELVLLIYLNERYGRSRVKISTLKKTLGYSAGGIYNALDGSGYFQRKGDLVTLSEKGQEYVKRNWIPYFQVVNPFSYVLMLFGSILLIEWYLINYHNMMLVFDWYQGITLIAVGLALRFGFSRMMYLSLRLRKKL